MEKKTNKISDSSSAKRDAIIAQAFDVFYREGFHAAAVDKLLEGSGISKRTLYKYFATKEDLVRATIDFYHQRMILKLSDFAESSKARNPVGKILALYDFLHHMIQSGHRMGCYALNAKLEYQDKDQTIESACSAYQLELQDYLRELCEKAGLSQAQTLSRQLLLIFHGAIVNSQVTQAPDAALLAKDLAKSLLESAAR